MQILASLFSSRLQFDIALFYVSGVSAVANLVYS